ncbi:hypothetical protein BGZ57DRAFT_973954 [Hyaloscypha finlandica]|nr:hypothetical protein F5882DRAFT_524738 [Hyaloscypha sp. PMI_1271]KAH8784358.1 hypothetical protein BGZ57DRAFT_973954 [Hyaloscypha finlandica]
MEGYAKLAQLMATHEEFAILRRFKTLNYQNLLYLQAEIVHLEQELAKLVNRDLAHLDRGDFAKDWWTLAHANGAEAQQQWKKILKIRKKLGKYNNSLLKQASIAGLGNPSHVDLDFLRSWLERPSMGYFPIRGQDQAAWDPRDEDDLIAIKARTSPDPFSKWFTDSLVRVYHRFLGEKFKKQSSPSLGDGIFTYKETHLCSILRILSTVVASILPVLSVVTLCLVNSNALKLGLIVLFSACFAFALALMTNARTIEVFAATSAFAAVNAVFLTNNISSTC